MRQAKIDSYQAVIDIDRQLCRQSLQHFIKPPGDIQSAWEIVEPATPYLPNWHIGAMAEYLKAVTDGQITRLVINIPPRYGKSLIVSVLWPSWVWTLRPSTRWLMASYSQDLSTLHSVNRRTVIESKWYQDRWGDIVELNSDQNLKTEFANTAQGIMTATSMTGTATGKGGDFVLLDDPLSPKSGESELERKAANRNFDLTFSTRLNDKKKGAIIIIMQRLNVDDVSGHALDIGYDHLCLPAVAAETTTISLPSGKTFKYGPNVTLPSGRIIERKVGDVLWPERETKEQIDLMRKALGNYAFAAQYGQTPAPEGGGRFKQAWFRYYEDSGSYWILHTEGSDKRIVKAGCHTFQIADLALSEKATADYTVIGTFAVTSDSDLVILDINRFRLEAPQVELEIENGYRRWLPSWIGIEKAHYGAAICQNWLRRGRPLRELVADRDKLTRSIPATLHLENGKVFWPANAEWTEDFERELLLFPAGSHDDQVDVLSYAVQCINDLSMGPAPEDIDLGFENRRVF